MQYRKPIVKQILIIIVLSLAVLVIALPVGAQTGTILAVDPEQGSVPLTGTTQIRLMVTDGVDINAFDIKIEYDASLLSLASWSYGDYLSNLFVVKKVDEPGAFRLVCTQLATPAVSGDGILLNLYFRGNNLGSSAITITMADFAHTQGGLTHPSIINGVLTVSNLPTATATATMTATATVTAKPTELPIATSTPTLGATTSTLAISTATYTPVLVGGLTETASVVPGETELTTTAGVTPTAMPEGGGGVRATPDAPAVTDDQPTATESNSGSNTLFWLLLTGGMLLLVVLVYLVIWNKQKEKHKLIEY